MKCPVCTDATLVMSDRSGIEIDYCPQCRGIWLDRGELDKLLERAGQQAAPAAAAPVQPAAAPAYAPQRPAAPAYRPDFEDSDFRHRSGGYPPKRRKSWLNEIFD
jgi:Zn-finger nucleic acid-binding protein